MFIVKDADGSLAFLGPRSFAIRWGWIGFYSKAMLIKKQIGFFKIKKIR